MLLSALPYFFANPSPCVINRDVNKLKHPAAHCTSCSIDTLVLRRESYSKDDGMGNVSFDQETVDIVYEEIMALSKQGGLKLDRGKLAALCSIGMVLLNGVEGMWGSLPTPPTRMKVTMVIGCICSSHYSFSENMITWPNSKVHSFIRIWSIIDTLRALDFFSDLTWVLEGRSALGFCRFLGLDDESTSEQFIPDIVVGKEMEQVMNEHPWGPINYTGGTYDTVAAMEFIYETEFHE